MTTISFTAHKAQGQTAPRPQFQAPRPAEVISAKQESFIRALLPERQAKDGGTAEAAVIAASGSVDAYLLGMTRQRASKVIATLLDRPMVEETAVEGDQPHFDVWPGIYTVEGDWGHRTFRVRIQDSDADFAPGAVLLEYLAGRDNTSDYVGFAFIRGGRLIVWKKFRTGNGDLIKAAEAFIADPEAALEAKHCARCGRELTNPESIRSGWGPECVKKGLR